MIPSRRVEAFLLPRMWAAWAFGIVLWIAWFISIVLGGGLFDRFGKLVAMDHLAFYSAARMIREDRAHEIYRHEAIAEFQQNLLGERWQGLFEAYRNPPFYALLYMPTAGLDYLTSAVIWSAISFLALYLGLMALGDPKPWRGFLWAGSFYPVFCAVSYGQNTLLSFGIFALTYRLLQSQRFFAAGCVAGLLAFKPTLLIGLIFWGLLDFRKRWPCALGAAVMGLLLCGGSYLVIPSAWSEFFRTLEANSAFDNFDWAKNHAPRAFWRLLLPGLPPLAETTLTLFTSALGVVAFVNLWLRYRDSLPVMFGAVVALTLWASPHALIYEWSLLLIPAVLWWQAFPGQRSLLRIAYAVVWLILLIGTAASQAQASVSPVVIQFSVPLIGAVGFFVMRSFGKSASDPPSA